MKAVVAEPGFSPGFERARGLAQQARAASRGPSSAVFDNGEAFRDARRQSYTGKLTKKRATGTLDATITIVERASGTTVATCRTG